MKLVLHGALAAEYGSEFELMTTTVPNAVRLLAAQLPGFRQKFVEGFYRVVLGRPDVGIDLDQSELAMPVPNEAHLIPVAAGAKNGGGIKAIIGGAILAFAIIASGGTMAAPLAGLGGTAFAIGGLAVSWGSVAMFGFAMAAAGVSQMLAPQVKADYESREKDQKPSFIFNGAVNTTEQGTVIPVVYGKHMIGSKPISAGLYIEQLEGGGLLPPPTEEKPQSDPGGQTPPEDPPVYSPETS